MAAAAVGMSPMAAAVAASSFPSCGPFRCPAAATRPHCSVSRRRSFSSVVAMASAAQ